MRMTVKSVNSAIDSITRDVHDMQNTIERFQSITRDIPLDRLEAMCDAERNGRLVVLPCKVGDTVYTIEEIYYPCSECDLDESKRDMCYRKKTGYPVETIHECPEVIYIKEHVARGFDIDGTLETGAILSLPGKWGYEGLEHFCGRDGKCYYTREEAEAALKEELK